MTHKNSKSVIVVDAMGGDFSPLNEVLGADLVSRERDDIDIILVGDKNKISDVMLKHKITWPEDKIVHADEVITMHDDPTSAIKSKPNSSLVVGAKLVREKIADGLISAGNTGAMLAVSTLVIGRVKGVGRPTIGVPLPTADGGVCNLFDAGASVDCKPQHLLEYAIMGSIFAREIFGIKNPKVGLLSVGEEESKGNELTLLSHKLLKETKLNFIGNIEGRDILKGTCDVAICDGFVGNVILKFAESMITLLKGRLGLYANESIFKKIKIGLMRGTLKKVLGDLDYQKYGGVPLLGINGVSIIGHGSSSPLAIKNMIIRAREIHAKDLAYKIEESLKEYAEQSKN